MVGIYGQTLYQPYLAPATYCSTSPLGWLLLYLFHVFTLYLLAFFFLCLGSCLRMVTTYMNVYLPDFSQNNSKPSWHLTLLLLQLDIFFLNSRLRRGFCVSFLTSLNLWGKGLLPIDSKPSGANVNLRDNLACIDEPFFRFWSFWIQVHFYVEANKSVWICLGCLYSAIWFSSPQAPLPVIP